MIIQKFWIKTDWWVWSRKNYESSKPTFHPLFRKPTADFRLFYWPLYSLAYVLRDSIVLITTVFAIFADGGVIASRLCRRARLFVRVFCFNLIRCMFDMFVIMFVCVSVIVVLSLFSFRIAGLHAHRTYIYRIYIYTYNTTVFSLSIPFIAHCFSPAQTFPIQPFFTLPPTVAIVLFFDYIFNIMCRFISACMDETEHGIYTKSNSWI